jgi:hypothetical protein
VNILHKGEDDDDDDDDDDDKTISQDIHFSRIKVHINAQVE